MPSPDQPGADRFAPYPLRERSKRSKKRSPPRFEVPEWAGGNSTNTCIVDSFLAALLCAQFRDVGFVSLIRGDSAFTRACREFLEDGASDMMARKMDFIRKLFKTDVHGEFNLEGDEANVILDKAKEACTINITTHCSKCEKEVTSAKDYYYSGLDKRRRMAEVLTAAITHAGRRHRCLVPAACKDAEQEKVLEVLDNSWMLPIDISQLSLPPTKINSCPPMIEVNDAKFRLTAVSLYGDSHYTAVLHDQTEWFYYDGLLTPPIKAYSTLKAMAFDPSCTLKIAYYLRSID